MPQYTYETLQRIEKILLNSQAYLMALHKFQEGRLDFAFRQVQRLFCEEIVLVVDSN